MGKRPFLHLSVVTIEKGASESPSTIVVNFTYLYAGRNIKSDFPFLFQVQ